MITMMKTMNNDVVVNDDDDDDDHHHHHYHLTVVLCFVFCVTVLQVPGVSMWSTNPHSSVVLYSDNVNVVPEWQLLSYVRMFDNEIVW